VSIHAPPNLHWVASVTEDGTVALWWTMPTLVNVKFFDAMSQNSEGESDNYEDLSAQPPSQATKQPSEVPIVVSTHLLAHSLPLSALYLLTTLRYPNYSIIRVHMAEPDPNLFADSVGDSTFVRCVISTLY
jgi:hypothetical protein